MTARGDRIDWPELNNLLSSCDEEVRRQMDIQLYNAEGVSIGLAWRNRQTPVIQISFLILGTVSFYPLNMDGLLCRRHKCGGTFSSPKIRLVLKG
jgi:hypothetical protein